MSTPDYSNMSQEQAEIVSGNVDDLFACPECGEELPLLEEGLCESCTWVDAEEALHYGEA